MAIDAEIALPDLSPDLLAELEQLAPHGYGNPPPVFALREARLAASPRLIQNKHLKMKLTQGGHTLEAIGWRLGHLIERLDPAHPLVDVVFQPGWNHFQGQTTLRLELLDFRCAGKL